MTTISPSLSPVKFGAVYKVNDDSYGSASRAIALRLDDKGIPALALNTSGVMRDNYCNLVVTGNEYVELDSLQKQMGQTLSNINKTAHARSLMVQLATRFQEAVNSMSSSDHPGSISLSAKSEHYADTYGDVVSLSNPSAMTRLDGATAEEVKALFENDLTNKLFVEHPSYSKFPVGSVNIVAKSKK